ncbi:hypothetical protein AVA65_08010 [Salmonella enterica subsp. enterica serovar Minnesota]|nr:hypothetical protein [Salmonella enterica subsp. enterica serovar Minnesota]
MILKLILEHYVPLATSGINKIELNVNHIVNLLISVNGSGKTSILKEMNPLPPDNGNYKSGGRKYIEMMHHQRHYVLDSYTGKSNGHSFKVDGKELNTGGTLTVQKNLVLQHFNLDANLNKVLSGLKIPDQLAAMSPMRRKEIFMRIYPNNTEYALGVYNKLRDERNSLKGAIKNQVSRYAEENRKLETLSGMTVGELEDQVKYIEEELKHALLLRGQLENAQMDPELREKFEKFNRLVDTLTLNVGKQTSLSHEELLREADRIEQMLDFSRKQADKYLTLINEYTKNMSGLNLSEQDPKRFKEQLDIINDELGRLNESVVQHIETLKNYPVFNDGETYEELTVIAEDFISYLHRITLASSPELTSGQYKQWLAEAEQMTNSIRLRKQERQQIAHQLKHMQQADVIECPDCNHKFKQGITPADIARVQQGLVNADNYIESQETALAKLQKQIENDAEWYYSMNQIANFVRENQHVRVLSTLMREYNLGKSPTEALINGLKLHCERVKLVKRRNALMEEESVLKGRIQILESNNMSQVLEQLRWAENQLADFNHGILLYKEKLGNVNRELEHIRRHEIDMETLVFLKEELYAGFVNRARAELRDTVDNIITTLGPRKDRHLTDIIRTRSLSSVVASIDEDIQRLKKRLTIVETLMDGLCPNKGLIGKLMSDFIQAVCGNMNAIIKEVWNERLLIKPCTKENGDLTYKFPVINGEDSVNPDIVDCSAGESEIINFAFRYVMLQYHTDYPMFMDEVGVYFDEINRGRFFNFIKNYALSGDCTQMFMISHYVNQYGIFKDANIIALKYDGLTINGEVNKHSVIH